jgi:hypothetical protein
MCLIRLQRLEEAQQVIADFIDEFPHSQDMTLITDARERIERARSKTAQR